MTVYRTREFKNDVPAAFPILYKVFLNEYFSDLLFFNFSDSSVSSTRFEKSFSFSILMLRSGTGFREDFIDYSDGF